MLKFQKTSLNYLGLHMLQDILLITKEESQSCPNYIQFNISYSFYSLMTNILFTKTLAVEAEDFFCMSWNLKNNIN